MILEIAKGIEHGRTAVITEFGHIHERGKRRKYCQPLGRRVVNGESNCQRSIEAATHLTIGNHIVSVPRGRIDGRGDGLGRPVVLEVHEQGGRAPPTLGTQFSLFSLR
jgi:hypothetical protein